MRSRPSRWSIDHVVILLVVCIVVALGLRVVSDHGLLSSAAERDVARRADNAAVVMSRIRKEVPAAYAAALVEGGPSTRSIEILEQSGTTFDGVVVLRITSRIPAEGWDSGSSAVVCYRYHIDHADNPYQRIDCPQTPTLAPTPAPPDPHLPLDAIDRLETTLDGLDPAGRASVRTVSDVVRAAFAGTTGEVSVAAAEDGAIGVAVTTGLDLDCLAARLPVTGPIQVWVPSRVVVQSGELGCTAGAFAMGLGQQAPH